MASIKISALPELDADRLTSEDRFIVNDENNATSIVKFSDLVAAISSQNLVFSGSTTFSGQVLVTGNAAGTNVYTRDEVDSAISSAVNPVATDLSDLTSRERDLETLVGATVQGDSVLTYFPIGTFTATSLQLASYTVKTAIERVGLTLDAEAAKILANSGSINTNSNSIAANTQGVADNKDEIDDLKAAVFTQTGDSAIGDNANNITGNADNIGSLANAVGVAVGATSISVGTITGGIIEAGGVDYSVVAALGALESQLVTTRDEAVANTTTNNTNATNISNVRDHSMATRNAVHTVCTQFVADVAGGATLDANDLAQRLLTAVDAIVDPVYNT